jgi:hypothetical protein
MRGWRFAGGDGGHGQNIVSEAYSAEEKWKKRLARGWRSPDRLPLDPPLIRRYFLRKTLKCLFTYKSIHLNEKSVYLEEIRKQAFKWLFHENVFYSIKNYLTRGCSFRKASSLINPDIWSTKNLI